MPSNFESVIALAKRRGFIFQTSQIYGGLANAYDYGPLGVELMRNLKNLWWRRFVQERDDVVGLDSQIILHPQTWITSGHVASFTDPLVEDKVTHDRLRADMVIDAWQASHPKAPQTPSTAMTVDDMARYLTANHVQSPKGNPITPPKSFNLLFETALGTIADDKAKVYLRGETAQGIFTNFRQVVDSSRLKLPFGIAQIGKSFRNEITQGQFIFRTFEFEQAEIEYFFDPQSSSWKELMEAWKDTMWQFLVNDIKLSKDNLNWRRHTDKERSHYSKDTYDLDYRFPFGFKELWGIAYRTDFDLSVHQKASSQSLEYTNPQTGEKIVPHVIEPALGVNRLCLALLSESYWEDKDNQRTVLKLPAHLAPYRAAVFPLLKNKPELVMKARTVYSLLNHQFPVVWDDRGNIGKRYYAQDEIGTPFCLTIDFDTLKDDSVTIRHRDSQQQDRVSFSKILDYINSHS